MIDTFENNMQVSRNEHIVWSHGQIEDEKHLKKLQATARQQIWKERGLQSIQCNHRHHSSSSLALQ